MYKSALRLAGIASITFFSGVILLKGLYMCWVSPSLDESVYMLMGKHLYSLGKSGLWEAYRPPFLPVLLGLIWKTGLDLFVGGRVLFSLMSLLLIYLTYRLSRRVFGEDAALFSVVFLVFSPVFIAHADGFFTEIPSTIFGLLGVFLWLRNRLFLCGVMCGVSFLTRFPQGLLFAGIVCATILFHKNYRFRAILGLIAGFASVVSVYLVLNHIFYKDVFWPFVLQARVIKAGWSPELKDAAYYVKIFIKKENIFIIFFLLGCVVSARNKSPGQALFCIIALAFTAYFHSIVNMLPRYFIAVMPYIFSVSGYGLSVMLEKALRRQLALLMLAAGLGAVFLLQKTPYLKWRPPAMSVGTIEKYIAAHAKEFGGRIWLSDPSLIAHTDLKADELMYYFDCAKARYLMANLDKADWIFLRPLGLYCFPRDADCLVCKNDLLNKINENFIKTARWQEEYRSYIYESAVYMNALAGGESEGGKGN